MGMVMEGALKCIVRLCDHVLGEFKLYGVITKQFFRICPKFEGKVVALYIILIVSKVDQ